MPDPLRIAQRMRLIDASGIRKVFDLAARLKDPINLSIGQPDFDVPAAAKAAAVAAIQSGQNKYTQTQGTEALLTAVAKACCREFGWHEAYHGGGPQSRSRCTSGGFGVPRVFDKRGYLITSGTSGALMLALLTLVDPGDEVVFFDPYFVMYKHLVNLCGGVPVPVSTYPSFRPNLQALADALTDKTRLLIINSPVNPTGAVFSRQELEAIAEIAARRELLVISDEIYNLFCYDQPYVSMVSAYDRTLLLRGWSKSYAMTGWRLGWCTGPAEIIEKMTMLQQYSFVCAPSMAQAGAAVALDIDMAREVAAYKRKRDMVYDALEKPFGLVKPDGAFYAFVPAPKGLSGSEFVARAVENNVLIIPGNVFSQHDTHFRLSYATGDQQLAKGLEVLVKLAK